MHDEFIKRVLELHRTEWPFKVGKDSKNRRRFYWLSGVLHHVAEQMQAERLPRENIPGTADEPKGETPGTFDPR